MKGMSFLEGQSPMRKLKPNSKEKTKTIAGEDTDVIKTDKKGKDYALSMFDQASGINKGDTLFAPRYKIPSVYGYVRGGENYEATETKDSKKRKKGPKSYTLKTQPAPTKMKGKAKGKTKEQLLKEGFSQVEADQMMKTGATTGKQPAKKKRKKFVPAYPGADISKAEYDKARKAGVKSEAEFAEYKAKKKKKKSPTKLKRKIKPTKAILRAKDIKKPGRKFSIDKVGNNIKSGPAAEKLQQISKIGKITKFMKDSKKSSEYLKKRASVLSDVKKKVSY